jgi:hypothetical protein
MVRLGVLKKPLELNELHQLIVTVPGVESPGLYLRQRSLTQLQVLLSSIGLNLLLPQELVKVDGVLSSGGASFDLVEVLFPSSLCLGPLCVEVSADLGKGSLRNPHLLFPRGEGLLPPHKLPLSCEEQFLQVLNHRYSRHSCGRARRSGRRKRPTQSKCEQINNASGSMFIYCMERSDTYLLTAFPSGRRHRCHLVRGRLEPSS